MVGVGSTLALLGLIALVIPVLIHLFNPGKGQLVWIGNIALVKAAQKQLVTERRVSQWLLLLIRMLILLVLTLVLAKAFYTSGVSEVDGDVNRYSEQSTDKTHQMLSKQRVSNKNDQSNTTAAEMEKSVTVYFDQATTTINTKTNNHTNINAALKTIKKYRLNNLKVAKQSTTSSTYQATHWIFWLSTKPLPKAVNAMIDSGSVAIAYGNGALHQRRLGKGVIYTIGQVNLQAWSKQANFPDQLLSLMVDEDRFADAKLSPYQIATSQAVNAVDKSTVIPLHQELLLLLILLWVTERWLAERVNVREAQL
jgi:hypothetical protein